MQEGQRIGDLTYTPGLQDNYRVEGVDPNKQNAKERSIFFLLEDLRRYLLSGSAPVGVEWVQQPVIRVDVTTISVSTASAKWQGLAVNYPAVTFTAALAGEGLQRVDAIYALEDGSYGYRLGEEKATGVTPSIPTGALLAGTIFWRSTGGEALMNGIAWERLKKSASDTRTIEEYIDDEVKLNTVNSQLPDENKNITLGAEHIDATVNDSTWWGTVKIKLKGAVDRLANEIKLIQTTLNNHNQRITSNTDKNTEQDTALNNKVDKVPGKGLSTNDYTTTEKDKLAGIQAGAQVNSVTSVSGKTGAVTLSKSDVGLSNVDNTSDANKPVSTAQQTALDGKVDKASVVGTTGNSETLLMHQKAITAQLNALLAELATKGLGTDVAALQVKVATLEDITASDDTTLDTVREIVQFIKDNKQVIDSISTTKVDKVEGHSLISDLLIQKLNSLYQYTDAMAIDAPLTNLTKYETATQPVAGDSIRTYARKIWRLLDDKLSISSLLGSTGQSTTAPMTQKAVTEALAGKADKSADNIFTNYQRIQRGAATNSALQALVAGDTVARYEQTADGKQEWGSGSAARDTNLYRGGVDLLKTDDKFNAVAGLQENGVDLINKFAPLRRDSQSSIITFNGDATHGRTTNILSNITFDHTGAVANSEITIIFAPRSAEPVLPSGCVLLSRNYTTFSTTKKTYMVLKYMSSTEIVTTLSQPL